MNLRLADCCQNCAHCVMNHLHDDPFSYYCNVEGGYIPDLDLQTRIDLGTKYLTEDQPNSPEVQAFIEHDEKREQWLVKHEVRAGNVCERFKRKGT